MIIISHRANIAGPLSAVENHPDEIDKAIKMGFDVEIDVWVDENNNILLGHDNPLYEIEIGWLVLRKSKLWLHCKNSMALEFFIKTKSSLNYFFHQSDDYTLTSKGFVWVYPGKELLENSIQVLPEISGNWMEHFPSVKEISGVCTDFPVLVTDLVDC